VSYAVTKREVTPLEQHVHSFLEMVPVTAVSFVSVLHWPKLLALFGIGSDRADWGILIKNRPLPARLHPVDVNGLVRARVAVLSGRASPNDRCGAPLRRQSLTEL
jgi:hypothetical protein